MSFCNKVLTGGGGALEGRDAAALRLAELPPFPFARPFNLALEADLARLGSGLLSATA